MADTNGVAGLGLSPDHDPHRPNGVLSEKGFQSHLQEPHLLLDVIYDHFVHILSSSAACCASAKKARGHLGSQPGER